MTREEVAVAVNNLLTKLKVDLTKDNSPVYIKDTSSISTWARTAVNNVVRLDIMDTVTNVDFKPKNIVTFEQLVVILHRLQKFILNPTTVTNGKFEGKITKISSENGKSYITIDKFEWLYPSDVIKRKEVQQDILRKFGQETLNGYEDEFGCDVVFQTSSTGNDFSYWTGMSNNFDISIICKDRKHDCKVGNLNKHLKIELLYKQHKDYVRDIIRNAVIYNDSRIDELLEQFPGLFQSKNEVLNSVFMSCIDKESWGKRPLSKLTHDVYNEFKIFVNNE